MIIQIVSNIIVILGIFTGEFVSSLVFKTVKGVKELILEILLFIVIINLFFYSTIVIDNIIFQLLLYFFFSFIAVIASRTILFLIFRKSASVPKFKSIKGNRNSLRLAKRLSEKISKSQVIELFRKSGYSSSFIKHLESILKE